MDQNRNNEPGMLDNLKRSANAAQGLAQCLSKVVEVFLRKNMGSHYLRTRWGIGFVMYWLFLLVPVETPDPELSWILFFGFGWASLVMSVVRSGEARLAFKRGEVRHSLYVGDSLLARWGMNDADAKRKREPSACVVAGILVLAFSPPLGLYLMAAGACLAANNDLYHLRMNSQVRALRDAQIEQAELAERLGR